MQRLTDANNIYIQGCIDGATRFADEVIKEMEREDAGKSRTAHKRAVEKLRTKRTSLTLESGVHGFKEHALPKGEYVNHTHGTREGWQSALSDYIGERGIRTAVAEFVTLSLFFISMWALLCLFGGL